MIALNLQLFGGRGGSGGKRTGSNSRIAEVKKDAKVKAVLEAAKKNWPEGDYAWDQEPDYPVNIGYEIDEYYNIYQTSQGQVYDGSRVQRMVEGQDSGKYRAWNGNEEMIVTSSAAKAAKHAWGTPKSAGYKKVKK